MNDTNKKTVRQGQIIGLVKSGKSTKRALEAELEVSRASIARDLHKLVKQGALHPVGGGRSTYYEATNTNPLLKHINPRGYFKLGAYDRVGARDRFDESALLGWENIFSKEELTRLDKLSNTYRGNVESLEPTILKKEFERLTIDLSWKSSHIEGNTYTLLDTEALIKWQQEARGHDKSEATMIMNHKKAFDYIRKHNQEFNHLTKSSIHEIHQLLITDLGAPMGIRTDPVGITGTKYRPIRDTIKIAEILEKIVDLINSLDNIYAKSLASIVLMSYLQAFADGNKRTSRMLGNALLLAHSRCPLSYRSVDDKEYKKAMLLFYEQLDVSYFKQLFIEQFEFAVDNYFLT